jgi:hypothetical protein
MDDGDFCVRDNGPFRILDCSHDQSGERLRVRAEIETVNCGNHAEADSQVLHDGLRV